MKFSPSAGIQSIPAVTTSPASMVGKFVSNPTKAAKVTDTKADNGQESGAQAEKMVVEKTDGSDEAAAAAKPGEGEGAVEDAKIRSALTAGEGHEEAAEGKKENGGGKEEGTGGGGQDEDEDEDDESVWMRTIRGRLMHIARTFATQIYECHEVMPLPPSSSAVLRPTLTSPLLCTLPPSPYLLILLCPRPLS